MEYTLKRTQRRRSMALVILPTGELEVRAPRWVAKREIETFIDERKAWIARHLDHIKRRPAMPSRTWQAGDTFYLHGKPYTLEVVKGSRTKVELEEGVLRLTSRLPESVTAVRRQLMAWMQQLAHEHFAVRLAELAAEMGEPTPNLTMTNARQRWGSCQARRRQINISLRLLAATPAVQDYVLVHELSHLKHMDHSSAFWARVAAFYPHWRAAEAELKHHANIWCFDA